MYSSYYNEKMSFVFFRFDIKRFLEYSVEGGTNQLKIGWG